MVIAISGLKDMLSNILNNKTQAKFAEHLKIPLNKISKDMALILNIVKDHINSFTPYSHGVNKILLKIKENFYIICNLIFFLASLYH